MRRPVQGTCDSNLDFHLPGKGRIALLALEKWLDIELGVGILRLCLLARQFLPSARFVAGWPLVCYFGHR